MELFVTETLEHPLIVAPTGLDLDENFKEHLAVEQALHVLPRFSSDSFQGFPALADDDPLVCLLVDDNRCTDAAQGAIQFEFFDLDGRRVGQLVANQAEELFTNVLGSKKTFALVGDFLLAVQQLIVRQMLARLGEEIAVAIANANQ